MKCPSCGAQMGLEDAACPYCGTPNAQAAQHQSDMARFREEYRRTQADVLDQTSFMSRQGSWLVIIIILLVALAAGIVLNILASDIGYSIREERAKHNAAQSTETMDRYLEQGDYGQFLGYYNANDISLDYKNPYQVLRAAANAYANIVQYAAELNNPNSFRFKPDYLSDTCEYLANDLNRVYTLERQYSYKLEEYLPADKLENLEDIRDRTRAIARTYFGLTDGDIDDIPNVSEAKLARMIEEGITR